MDIVSVEKRSKMMAGIKGKNTKPEIIVRRELFARGFRFRLHRKDLPGSPDIVLPSKGLVIFVHGCYWHQHDGCRLATLPTSNIDFWRAKLERNVERDRRAAEALRTSGWRVLVVRECATKGKAAGALGGALSDWIEGGAQQGEISTSSGA